MPRDLTLPAEGVYTEAELHFIELSPDGLWPDNQDSNFGQFRKVVTDIIQEDFIDLLSILNMEAFYPTSTTYLSLWEEMVGLPTNPSGRTSPERRSAVGSRLEYGAFTRSRRRRIVEAFIVATFGESVSFTPDGIPITVGGIPLFSGVFSLSGTYEINEAIERFYYQVKILDTIDPDVIGLTRELDRITPDGITFDVNLVPSL